MELNYGLILNPQRAEKNQTDYSQFSVFCDNSPFHNR